MGKKYIIELEEPEMFDERKYYQCSQMPWWSVSENIVENLTPYTEPNLDAIRKEAYDKGCETAKHECEQCRKVRADAEQELAEKAYQRGLNDAWEAARKIILDKEDGGLDTVTYNEIFGYGKGVRTVLKIFTASEAIEKIRQYEQEQKEFHVGDEVELKCGVRPAIYMQGTKGSDEIYLLFNDGSCGLHSKSEIERKTGRHFPEIAEVLRKMKENSDG